MSVFIETRTDEKFIIPDVKTNTPNDEDQPHNRKNYFIHHAHLHIRTIQFDLGSFDSNLSKEEKIKGCTIFI